MAGFAVADVKLPGLDVSVDDIKCRDAIKATGKQGLFVVDAEGLNLMPEEAGQQVVEPRGVSVLVGVPVGLGGTEELRPDVLVQQTAEELGDPHKAIGFVVVDGLPFPV